MPTPIVNKVARDLPPCPIHKLTPRISRYDVASPQAFSPVTVWKCGCTDCYAGSIHSSFSANTEEEVADKWREWVATFEARKASSNVVVIPREPCKDIIEILEDALTKAQEGCFISVAISAITVNKNGWHAWHAGDNNYFAIVGMMSNTIARLNDACNYSDTEDDE